MAPVQGKVPSEIPKWQLALLIGIPATIGVAGAYYYYKKNKGKKKPNSIAKDAANGTGDQRKEEHVEKVSTCYLSI